MTIPGYRETWILVPAKATICEETGKVSALEKPSYPECDEAIDVFGEFQDRKETMSWLMLFPSVIKLFGQARRDMWKGWLK